MKRGCSLVPPTTTSMIMSNKTSGERWRQITSFLVSTDELSDLTGLNSRKSSDLLVTLGLSTMAVFASAAGNSTEPSVSGTRTLSMSTKLSASSEAKKKRRYRFFFLIIKERIHMNNIKQVFTLMFVLFALTFSNKVSFSELSEKVIAMADERVLHKEQKVKKERQKVNSLTEEDRVAKAVAKLYKTTKYKDTKKVVKLVYKHARKQKIKPMLVIGLIASESGFRRTAVSSHGAIGYTQVLPKYHQDKIAGRDVFDPKVNIEVGIKILSYCIS